MGRVAREVKEDSGMIVSSTEYLYEENGNITKTEYAGAFEVGYVQYILVTDKDRNVVKEVRYVAKDIVSDWIEYDAEGKLIKKTDATYFPNEHRTNLESMTEYHYDEEGVLIAATIYKNEQPSGRKEYIYDDAGNISKISTYDIDDNLVFWQDYFYDEYNNLILVDNEGEMVDKDVISLIEWTYTYY